MRTWGQSNLMKSHPSPIDLFIWKLLLEVGIWTCFFTLHNDSISSQVGGPSTLWKDLWGKRGYDAGTKQKQERGKGFSNTVGTTDTQFCRKRALTSPERTLGFPIVHTLWLVLSQLCPSSWFSLSPGLTLVLPASSSPPKPNPAALGLLEDHCGLHSCSKVLSGHMAHRQFLSVLPQATWGGEREVSIG